MPTSDSSRPPGPAPWESVRNPSGKKFIQSLLPWMGGLLLLSAIVWGLWPKPVIIETGTAARGPLTVFVSEEGKTRIRNRYIIAAPTGGKLHRIPLKPGDAIEAGKTLISRITPNPPPMLDSRARLQAEALVSMHETARKRASESLTAARTALDLAVANRDRMRTIRRDGSLSDADRDRMEAEASIKATDVRAAEFSLQIIDYETTQARANLVLPVQQQPSESVEITSPVSGSVLRVIQESETIVSPGMALLEVGDLTDLEIEAEILSRDAVSIHPGGAVSIEQWGGENPLKGRVRRVEPAAFTKISALGVEEQRVIVLCDLVDPPEAVKALGDRYRVETRIAIWHADDVLTIPAGALFRQGNTWKTFVYDQESARLTTVEAGRSDGRFTEILSGLQPSDQVLLHPPDNVKDGTHVKKREGP